VDLAHSQSTLPAARRVDIHRFQSSRAIGRRSRVTFVGLAAKKIRYGVPKKR
jgi:hypothetical protein